MAEEEKQIRLCVIVCVSIYVCIWFCLFWYIWSMHIMDCSNPAQITYFYQFTLAQYTPVWYAYCVVH